MKDVSARVQMIVGQAAGGIGFTEMEYDPYERAVIFRDPRGTTIRINPYCLKGMIGELTNFLGALNRLGLPAKQLPLPARYCGTRSDLIRCVANQNEHRR